MLILVSVVVGEEGSYPGVMQRIIIEEDDKERDQCVCVCVRERERERESERWGSQEEHQ